VICFKKFIFANIIFSGIIAYYYSNLLVNTELQRTLKLIIKGLSLCLISIGVSDNKTYVVLTLCIFRIEILSRLRNNFFGQISNNSLIKRHKNSLKKKIGLLEENKGFAFNCIRNSENNFSQYSEDSISQYSDESFSKFSSDYSNYEMSTVYSRPKFNKQIYSRKFISIEEYRIQTSNCTESQLHEMKCDFRNSFNKLKILKKLSTPYR